MNFLCVMTIIPLYNMFIVFLPCKILYTLCILQVWLVAHPNIYLCVCACVCVCVCVQNFGLFVFWNLSTIQREFSDSGYPIEKHPFWMRCEWVCLPTLIPENINTVSEMLILNSEIRWHTTWALYSCELEQRVVLPEQKHLVHPSGLSSWILKVPSLHKSHACPSTLALQ
jgi:hypothetical protein